MGDFFRILLQGKPLHTAASGYALIAFLWLVKSTPELPTQQDLCFIAFGHSRDATQHVLTSQRRAI